jgi:hypothetical protein
MNAPQNTKEFHKKVGRYVYDHLIKTSEAPTIADVARALSSTVPAVKAAYQRLAEERTLVLQETTGEVLMVPPFSAVPTSFHVKIGNREWWANCIWDAVGIPAMLKEDALVTTSCPCRGDGLIVTVKDGSLAEKNGIPHFALPAKRWWENILFT